LLCCAEQPDDADLSGSLSMLRASIVRGSVKLVQKLAGNQNQQPG